MTDPRFSLGRSCKNSSRALGGVLQVPDSSSVIHVWKNHSISSPCPVVSYLEWVSGSQKEEKEETHSGSKAGGQDRGERVEGSGVEVVMTVQKIRSTDQKLRHDEVGGGRRVGRRIFYVKLIYQ